MGRKRHRKDEYEGVMRLLLVEKVTWVSMKETALCPRRTKELAEAASHHVTSFRLSETELDVRVLAEALKENHCITRLVLHKCSINAEGARALAEALKVNQTVTELNLSCNQIGALGAIAISEAWKNALVKLDLSQNRIGSEGAQAIAHSLEAGDDGPMKHLNLSDNNLTPADEQALCDALLANGMILSIRLRLYLRIRNAFHDVVRRAARCVLCVGRYRRRGYYTPKEVFQMIAEWMWKCRGNDGGSDYGVIVNFC